MTLQARGPRIAKSVVRPFTQKCSLTERVSHSATAETVTWAVSDVAS